MAEKFIFPNGREFKDIDDFYRQQADFWKQEPKSKPKPIECLNLIMRREFAEQILHGEKKLEFRAYTKHYVSRIIDKDVDNYVNEQGGTEDDDLHTFADVLRPVFKIHFHNYNNSWYLDVECPYNFIMPVARKWVEDIQEQYGCHDLDEMLEDLEKSKATERPLFFVFECGKVLDTNLK